VRVGELYSEKDLFIEPIDQSTLGKGIEGEGFKPITNHIAGKGEGTQQGDLLLL
jgi:hypothetical protein